METSNPPSGSALAAPPPALDPQLAVELLLHQAELLRIEAGVAAQPVAEPMPSLRDLSPLGR